MGYSHACLQLRNLHLMRRKIVAGNWKLHGTRAFATELVAQVAAHMPWRVSMSSSCRPCRISVI